VIALGFLISVRINYRICHIINIEFIKNIVISTLRFKNIYFAKFVNN